MARADLDIGERGARAFRLAARIGRLRGRGYPGVGADLEDVGERLNDVRPLTQGDEPILCGAQIDIGIGDVGGERNARAADVLVAGARVGA